MLLCMLIILGVSTTECSVRWYAFGDWGDIWLEQQNRVAAGMDEYAYDFQPEFIVSLGDNFYQNGIHSVDDPKIDRAWREPYNLTNLHQSDLPWWLVAGNHDYGLGLGEEWFQVELSAVDPLWNMPNLWYDHIWSDGDVTVHLIMVDTEALDEGYNNFTVMMEWLNDTLTESTADWVLVGAHHPIFSCGDKGPVSGSYYDKLLPTLDYHRGKLDLYMTGHDHNVQLLQKIDDPGYFDFVISGAGAYLYRENLLCESVLGPDYGIDKVFMEVTGSFAAMEATPEWLNISFIDSNATTMYWYTRYKVPGTPGSIFDPVQADTRKIIV